MKKDDATTTAASSRGDAARNHEGDIPHEGIRHGEESPVGVDDGHRGPGH